MSAVATERINFQPQPLPGLLGVLPFRVLPIRPGRKENLCGRILIVVSVLNFSGKEQKRLKRRGLAKSGLKRLYHIPVLSKALDILELLQGEKGPLALEAIYQRTSISKTTVYRILKTFVHRGYLAQSQDGLYRLVARPRRPALASAANPPICRSRRLSPSLKAASSARPAIDLIVLDNRYDGATALRNADEFVRNRVDLVIEFQIDQHVAPVLRTRFTQRHPIDCSGHPASARDLFRSE